MDDLELLMMAAKAIGRKVKRIDGDSRTLCGIFFEDHDPDDYSWNPLTDDGDALRLAVKLRLAVHAPCKLYRATAQSQDLTRGVMANDGQDGLSDTDPYAATRRAIVHAAAEIGKGMLNG